MLWQHGPISTLNMQLKGDQSNVSVTVHIVVGGDRVALVDTGLVWAYDQLEEALGELRIPVGRIDLVLNTHEHMDHIGNNARVVRESGALVGAHPRRAAWIEDHRLGAEQMVLRFPDAEPVFDPKPEYLDWMEEEQAPVHLRLLDGNVINLGGGVELEVIELHGHSLGEIGFLERSSGTLVFGDALMPTHVPVLFLYEEPHHTRATCRRIMQLARDRDVRAVLSGHAEPCGRDEAIAWAGECLERTVQIERAIVEAVQEVPGGELARIRDVVTERLGKLREWRALITIDGHLRDLERQGVIARSGGGWELAGGRAATGMAP
ncbi:MAG: MBL fold metallo-hydrolase [Thermoleophilia bacterium]|nr:MBL fold metallo-hydrolase [Thermoleophilia bacterium]